MNYKKMLAVLLAATMVVGNSVVVFAEDKEASASGEGETQYVATSDVFDVFLPTAADNTTTFNYLLDPDGLIAKTTEADGTGGRYSGKFEAGKTVYFKHATAVSGNDYTDTSDEIKVVNKSTQAVDLTVTAKVTPVDGITMAAKDDFTNEEGVASTGTDLYLGLIGKGSETTDTQSEKAITADGVKLEATIPADENAYEVTWNATANDGKGQYERALTTAAQAAGYAGFKSYSFKLTGKCNTGTGIDWSGLDENAPKVDLVWSVKDFTITGPQVSVGKDGIIRVTNLDGALYQSMQMSIGDESWELSSKSGTWAWEAEESGKKEFTLGSGWYPNFVAGKTVTVTVTLKDGTTIQSAPVTFDAV